MRSRLGAMSTTVSGAVVLCAVLVALFTVGLLGAPAGAQSQEVFSCSYTVGPTTLPPGGGFVTVEGTAPGTSVVRIFADGTLVAVTSSAPVTGDFSAQIFVTGSVEISVALDDYPNAPCIGVGGSDVRRGGGSGTGSISVGGTTLARTGSSGTGALVRFGVVAVGLGLALAVAARRRHEARGSD